MVCDESKYKNDARYKLQSIDDYDNVWSSVNYQQQPYYHCKEYKQRYVILDEDIIEDSPTGCFITIKVLNFVYKCCKIKLTYMYTCYQY